MSENNTVFDQVEKIVEDFDGKQIDNNKWQIHCPCEDHEDRNPSCVISIDESGKLLVHCFVCDEDDEPKAFESLQEQGYLEGSPKRDIDDETIALYDKIEDILEFTEDGIDELEYYLKTRGVDLSSACLNDFCHFSEKVYSSSEKKPIPALLFKVTNTKEDIKALHVIYLDENFNKAAIDTPKIFICNKNLEDGDVSSKDESDGRVVLKQGKSGVVHIGEGVETMLAVLAALDSSGEFTDQLEVYSFDAVTKEYNFVSTIDTDDDSFYAALRVSSLAKQEFEDNVKTVHIWGDNDSAKNINIGVDNANKLAKKLLEQNKTVFVHIPEATNSTSRDWLDAYRDVVKEMKNCKPKSAKDFEEKKVKSKPKPKPKLKTKKNSCDDNVVISIPPIYYLTDSGVYMKEFHPGKKVYIVKQLSRDRFWVQGNVETLDFQLSEAKNKMGFGVKGEILIEYYDVARKANKKVIIESKTLSDTAGLKRLFEQTNIVPVEPSFTKHIASYLSAEYTKCKNNKSLSYMTKSGFYAKIDGRYTHTLYNDNISFYPDDESAKIFNAYKQPKGNMADWIDNVLEPLSRSENMSFIFSAAIAAPLLKLLDLKSITLALSAFTGSGKTTSCHAALSVFSEPKSAEIAGSSSKAGIFAKLNMVHSLPILIDELQLADTSIITNLIYDVGNNGEAAKAKSDGTSRNSNFFSCVVFVTGEQAISELLKYNGTEARLMYVNSNNYFEKLSQEEGDSLIKALKNNHSLVGKPFFETIENLPAQDILKSMFNEHCYVLEKKAREARDNVQLRQADRYAAFITAVDCLQKTFESTEYKEKIKKICQRLRDAIIGHQLQSPIVRKENSISQRALRKLIDFVYANSHNFNYNPEKPMPTYGAWQSDKSLGLVKQSLKETILGNEFEITEVLRQWSVDGIIKTEAGDIQKSSPRFTCNCSFKNETGKKLIRIIAPEVKDVFNKCVDNKQPEQELFDKINEQRLQQKSDKLTDDDKSDRLTDDDKKKLKR